MKRVGIVYLITEAPEARGVLDAATETRRKTYCEEKSLSMSEVYQANATGFSPSIRLLLPQDFEYRGDDTGSVTTSGTTTTDEDGNTVILVEDAKTKISVSLSQLRRTRRGASPFFTWGTSAVTSGGSIS